MNAQQIIKIVNTINPSGFGDPRFSMIPENKQLFDEVYELARQVEPCDKYRNGLDRKFWLWTDKGSYEEFADTFRDRFTYLTFDDLADSIEPHGFGSFSLDERKMDRNGTVNHEKMEKAWPEYFPDDTVWFSVYLAEFQGKRGVFIGSMFGSRLIIDTEKKPFHKMDMAPLLEWLIEEEKKCIDMIREGTYSAFIAENLPFEHRSGTTKLSTYWKYVPEDRNRLFGEIDPDELKEFLEWEVGEENGWEEMTANDYLRACDSLYELMGIKEKYPIRLKDDEERQITPKDCFMAYSGAIHYSPVQRFLDLDGDSPEAFRDFVLENFHDHDWDAVLMHDIRLVPEISIDDKYYLRLSFRHEENDYPLLIHLLLELRRRGFPVLKRADIEELMAGNKKISIKPQGDDYDWKYEYDHKIKTSDFRFLPKVRSQALIKKIRWFPTGEWSMLDDNGEA